MRLKVVPQEIHPKEGGLYSLWQAGLHPDAQRRRSGQAVSIAGILLNYPDLRRGKGCQVVELLSSATLTPVLVSTLVVSMYAIMDPISPPPTMRKS